VEISLIASPYDLGRNDGGMALGPNHYLEAGAKDSLAEEGFSVEVQTVERRGEYEDEPGAVSEVEAEVANHVRRAAARGALPLVLGGNCDTALGVLAGMDDPEIGVIWFDAHGDFNTPETSNSGYLGGMILAAATGRYNEEVRERIGHDGPVPERNVVHVGARDLDPEERASLESSAVSVVEARQVRREGAEASLSRPLENLASQVREVYVHLDIDSLDPEHAPGVVFPTPDGLTPEEVEEVLRLVAHNFEVKAAAMTAFDPERDEDDRTLQTGMRLMGTLAEAAAASRKGGDA
jgi:arginase